MNIAEMLLRLGCALVAWIVLFTYGLWMLILRQLDCSADGDSMWRLMLGFAPLAILFSFLLGSSRPLTSVHELLRWLRYPLLILLALSAVPIAETFMHATINDNPICEPSRRWHTWWAPAQFLTIAIIGVRVWRVTMGKRST